ncbi:TetR/AcrR family transcriptional regulator [Vibrio superstes]|uniref:TetR family transcriptional regulator n=1 Tax=Vibrio superstes NBRC 103154 TaxID=1219062 RepID=A0A511QNG9_9VIBR|nr:TetR/AcrR family transcriptional regulator [Vibrio superstes]GEM78879.1 TetR family transcriptional regulator [Vibrio superstes NBRC 103154]
MITKRDQILKSALQLFAEQGMDNTSTAQIAKAAGVAKATLFHHFENKSKLEDELFVDLKKSLFGDLGLMIDDPTLSLSENIKRVWIEGVNSLISRPAELMFFNQIQHHPKNETRNQVVQDVFEPLEAKLLEAQRQGLLSSIPVEVLRLYSHSHTMYCGLTLLDNAKELSMSHDEFIELSFVMYWKALGGE